MEEITYLKQENEKLKQKVTELEEKLKKYTAPARSKVYYENHKEEHKQRVKAYIEKTGYNTNSIVSSDKKKEYNKRAYLKKKESKKANSETLDVV